VSTCMSGVVQIKCAVYYVKLNTVSVAIHCVLLRSGWYLNPSRVHSVQCGS
jgi:hypothetical protein